MRRGYTLLELLIVLAMTAVLGVATATSFAAGAQAQRRIAVALEEDRRETDRFAELRSLFTHAYLSPDPADPTSYFVATETEPLAFTVAGRRIPAALLDSREGFEENNRVYGPRGGVTEVGLSETAVGQGGGGRQGLFERTQTPSDGDPSQGGQEKLLLPDLTGATFEFFDGTDWVPTWDTRTQTPKRLPAAVRMSWRSPEGDDRQLTFAIPASDVTEENPVAQQAVTP